MKQETVKVEFTPANEKQQRFMFSEKDYVLFSGAIDSGKTFLGCWKIFMKTQQYPGGRWLICRKENASLYSTTLVTLFEKVIPKELIYKRNDQKGYVELFTPDPNLKSTIVFSGLDKKANQDYPTKIGSAEFVDIFVDEIVELDLGDFEMLSTRNRWTFKHLSKEENENVPRQLFGATNPEAPTHFLYKFFFKDKKPDREVILATIYDNPYASAKQIKKHEQTLTGLRRERLLFGKWVQAEGAIYDTFDYDSNVINIDLIQTITQYKLFFAGADSNFPIPRAGVIFGLTSTGEIHILDEFYEANSQPEKLGQWFSDFALKYEISIDVYHDPSDPSAIDKINSFDGLTCTKAMNAVVPGISCVHKYITKKLLKVNERCVNIIHYMGSYSWKKGCDDVPDKKEDHLPDAIRYGLFTYDNQVQVDDIAPPMFMN